MNIIGRTIEPRTAEEIEALKANWRNDPCWDIEDTEGFDLHRDELVAYRLEWEVRWKAQREQRLLQFAAPLGLENNLALAECLMRQEAAIEALKEMIQQLQERLPNGN